jgi:uncharacterized protein YbbK (DUF523 family)
MKDKIILVSACLAGINCKYDGKNKLNRKIRKLVKEGKAIPVCPEQLGGLPTPREPVNLTGDGYDVLNGKAKVLTKSGKDVTLNFINGAREVLKLARLLGVKEAIMKARSPSCGSGQIRISGKVVKGDGVCAALLKRNGIKVYTEKNFNEFADPQKGKNGKKR